MLKRCSAIVAGILLVLAGNARAQEIGASEALVDILFGSNGQGALDLDVVAALGVVLPSEAATFPLASSSGGFTWTFDPKLGVQTRRTQSFGPMFAERPFTNGRKKFSVGIAYQHTAYDSLAGQPLSALTTVDSPQISGGIQRVYSSDLSFKTDRTIISATYGVTDRVDVGVLVPIEHTTASGSAHSNVTVLNLPAGFCATGYNPDGTSAPQLCPPAGSSNVVVPVGRCIRSLAGRLWCPFTENNITGTSSGIGDVIVRGKVALVSMPMLDLGAGVDLRLPTGDDTELLGLGKAQTKVMLMGSSTHGVVAPHFNVGYTFSGSGIPFNADGSLALYDANGDFNSDKFQPSPEISYTFGADVAVSPIVTVMGDVIGRSLRHSATFDFTTSGASSFFTVSPGTLNLIIGTVGAKVKIGGDFLLIASVVFPLNSAGIKPGVTPVVGFERAF